MQPRNRALLGFLLGILLVLNPVFVFPQGLPAEKTFEYRAEPIERQGMTDDALRSRGVDVVNCDRSPAQRTCVYAARVGYGGERRIENASVADLPDDRNGLSTHYEYVRFEEGLARPNATLENGALVLSFDPVSADAVLRRRAVAFETLPSVGAEAIRTGSAQVTQRYHDYDEIDSAVPEFQRLVTYEGDVYLIRRYPKERSTVVPSWLYWTIRMGGVVGGAAIAFHYAGWHARLTDRREGGG